MDNRRTHKTAFTIIGISCRTSNKSGAAQQAIPELWETFMNGNYMQQIPKRINEGIYCVYTDYESDANGDYTVIIGTASIDTDSELTDGLIRHTLPESDYLCLPVKGDYPVSLIRTWEWVWTTDLPRSYTSDFEYYPEGMSNPNEPKLDVYIALTK